MNTVLTLLYTLLLSLLLVNCSEPKEAQISVKGWNILSDSKEDAKRVIDVAASDYDINHLQLSHHIVHFLQDVKQKDKRELTNELTDYAHQKGIEEVCVWDHALYNLNYYPDSFKRKVDGKLRLNLDDQHFWDWFKNDYREMLALVPNIDGIILTFIETGAHVEDQYSEILKTDGEKLAALVDTLANVIINEHHLKLYIRTFIYNESELTALLDCIQRLQHPDIVVMIKEVPHDFFLTHPVSYWVNEIKYPVIIEFDAAHEYNGEGIITSVFPETHLKRWKYYLSHPNVIGYVARTDRYGDTRIIDTPNEINLYALKRGTEDSTISINTIYDEFITQHYGQEALKYVKPAFENSFDITTSVHYTLGIQNANHTSLNYDRRWVYLGHNSGKWHKNKECYVAHDVNRTFHYWKDVANHLCPARYKNNTGQLGAGIPFVFENNWFQEEELMNVAYLNYIVTEKNYGVNLAQSSLEEIKKAQTMVADTAAYNTMYYIFERTEITARMFRAAAKAYFGYRVYCRGEEYRTEDLQTIIWDGIDEMKMVAQEIRDYKHKGPVGQFSFESSATLADEMIIKITKDGWEKGMYGGQIVAPRD